MGFEQKRKLIKIELLNTLKGADEKEWKKLTAIFSLKTGMKISTLETYIEELKQAGQL